MKRIFFLFVLLVAPLFAATSVTQGVFTWTFDTDYTVGQYANGDYYVVAPSNLTITDITPRSVVVASRANVTSSGSADGTYTLNSVTNGSMLNPTAGQYPGQGFDSGADIPGWNSAKNVGRPNGSDISGANPLVLAPGSSLLSSKSYTQAKHRPQLTDAAVLTVVSEAPPAGSFRPAYCGTDKRVWNKSAILYSRLSNKAAVAGTAPTLGGVVSSFTDVWIDFYTSHDGRDMHASNNQPEYGGDMGSQIANAGIVLNLAATDAEKEAAAIRFIQYGIDLWGAAKAGGNWVPNGGHNIGRKFAMLFAAVLLDDAEILSYADNNIFQEDRQIFTVQASDLLVVHYEGDGRTRSPYIELPVTFSAGTTNINYSGGPFFSKQRIKFVNTGGALPPELNSVDTYIIRTISTGVMQVETVWGGTPITFSTAGTGTHLATMVGIKEWGEKHGMGNYDRDGSNWGVFYRDLCFRKYVYFAIAARSVTGMRDLWANQSFFDYCDMVMLIEGSGTNFGDWFKNFWAAYRYGGGSPPLTPSGFSVTSTDFTSATIQWTDNSGGATEESYYEVQTSDTAGSGYTTFVNVPTNIGTGVMTYTLPALPSGRTKYIRLRAVNAADVSAWSSEDDATMLNYGPAKPNRSPRVKRPGVGGAILN
jgi:hypothetical protein